MNDVTDSLLFDDSRWPFVEIHFPSKWDDEAFEGYLRKLEKNLDRTEAADTKTAILFAAADAQMTATQRRRQAEWIKANRARSTEFCVGYAFILPSALLRGMFTAILWITPMPAPHIVVETMDQGRSWLLERLALESIDIERDSRS